MGAPWPVDAQRHWGKKTETIDNALPGWIA
jgi:hypothetical protein